MDILNKGEKMKWHYIKMVLIVLGAIFNCYMGVMYISGDLYELSGVNPEIVYDVCGNFLKTVDVVYGVICIIIATISICICISLKKRKKNSHKTFTCFYFITLGINVIYNIFVAIIMEKYTIALSSILYAVGYGMFAYVDYNYYYKNREYMFIN